MVSITIQQRSMTSKEIHRIRHSSPSSVFRVMFDGDKASGTVSEWQQWTREQLLDTVYHHANYAQKELAMRISQVGGIVSGTDNRSITN